MISLMILMTAVKLSNLIGKDFYDIHHWIKEGKYTHYWLKGGRGSLKSSFVGIEIVNGMMRDAANGKHTNAYVVRRYKNDLSDSVVEQIKWAIEMLGVSSKWDIPVQKLEITYKPTGQKIMFAGLDKPGNIRSTKDALGDLGYLWYEELHEMRNMRDIRDVNQSLLRGMDNVAVFYTYNPPQSVQSWVNMESQIKRSDKVVHESNYLNAPKEWLGKIFLQEANHLKKVNPEAYKHEYMGVVTGTGGEVFKNVRIETITDEQIGSFDQIRRGIDFGYSIDPFVYHEVNYDSKRKILHVFKEICKTGMSNHHAAEVIREIQLPVRTIIADSAEPKSINEMSYEGLRIKGAKKGPDSVRYGMEFLELTIEQIIIDGERCPNAAKEFQTYELDRDSSGEFKADYPDYNNHSIDAIRYALEDDMSRNRAPFYTAASSREV